MMDKPTFEEIYLSCYDRVYKIVYMRILDRENTEDIVQEVFIKAMNAYERFDPEIASPSTWLSRIAANSVTDYLRKNAKQDIISFDEYVESGYEPGVEDKELLNLTDENARYAYTILKDLKDSERELLMLRYGMELSYGEIAEHIGSNEKAIAKRMERLLEKCKKIAEEQINT